MKCKFCDAQLEEDQRICPACGKENLPSDEMEVEETNETAVMTEAEVEEAPAVEPDNEEQVEGSEESVQQELQEEKTKPAAWKLILMIAGVLAAVILFVCLILADQGVDLNPMHWFAGQSAGEETSAGNYPLNRDSYTASEKNADKQAEKIAATSQDMELSNAQLQIYYWSGVYEFVSQYQYYLEGMGLDLSKPLDEQSSADGTTWQQFFLQNAFNNWHKYSALVQQAKADGHEMSQAQAQQLESLPSQLEQLAQTGGYDSVDAMIQKELGPLCTKEAYLAYMESYYLAVDYFNTQYDQMKPTDAQVEAYFNENQEKLAQSGITKESKNYDVRHILIAPESDDAEATEFTDAQWEACRVKAQQLLDDWKNGDGTEEGFAELAQNHSADGGSSTNGGLYTGLNTQTNFVQEFKDWYLDENRQTGDTGLVKSTHGYHIMYFSDAQLNWQAACYEEVLMEMSESFVQECMENWPVKLYDKNIAIGTVSLVTE